MRLEISTSHPNKFFLPDETILEDSFSEVEDLLERGIEHAKNERRTEAREDLLRVTEKDPQNETAWMWLASLSEYPEELLVFLQTVLRINPENQRALEWEKSTKSLLAKTFVQRGIEAVNENRKDWAKQCFLQAICNDDKNELAWMWLASVTDSLEEKSSHLQKALAINPENKTAIDGLNSVNQLLAAAEPDESDELFEKLTPAKNGDHSVVDSDLSVSSVADSEVHVCPFCEVPKNFDTIFCEACHALQSFDDVEKLFEHTGVKEELLQSAIERLENEKLKTDLTSGELMQLGLAYFNVKDFEKGLATLEEALVKEPKNFPLETTISMIKLRNSEPVHSPESETVIAESPSAETAVIATPTELQPEVVSESPIEHESVSTLEPVHVSGDDEAPVPPIPQPQEPVTPNNGETLAKTIMLVDGNPTVRKLVAAKLERNGFSVVLATNGAEAITKLDEITPDLVLLDIEMPHLDGYEVCKIIRETESAKNVPVILISEKGFIYEEQKANSVGANGHITKPFGPGTLMKTVSGFLS